MASIFDYSTYGMTPAEIEAMEAEVKKQRPYINPDKLPSTVNKGMGGIIGEYLSANKPIPQSVAGLLGSDPVSTQYGSRVNPNATSGTMYGGKGGAMGPDIDAAKTTPGASTRWTPSGVHPDTPSPKASGWVPPSETRQAMGAVEKGTSLLGKFGKVLGPLGIAYDLANPEAVGEGSELSPAQREAKNPGEREDAQAYARRVQENARQAVREASGANSQSLLYSDEFLDSPGNVAAAVEAEQAVQAPPVERTPVGPVAQSQPVTVEQAAAATAQQRESQRQTVEAGAQQALLTNQVTRPQLAQEIVTADAARAGKQLTPDQSKAAVTEELGMMKGMDNKDLSRYVSYALIAGGLAASFLDKSGKAGDMFAASFNKQLDRNLASGIANKKNAAAVAKQAQDLQIALIKAQEASRGNDIREKSVDQTGRYQEGQLEVAEDRTEIQRGTLGLGYAKEGRQASQGAAGLGLRAQALELQRELGTRNLDLKEEANTLKAAGAAIKAAKGSPGVPLTEKGAKTVVSDFANQQGFDLDSNARSALASQVQQASKNDPEWAKNPAKVMTKILQSGGYTKEANPGIPFVPFTGGGTKYRQKKYQQ